MMKLEFSNVEVDCILGILPHEREQEQTVLVDLSVHIEPARIPQNDRDPPLDTRTVNDLVHSTLVEGRFHLQETAVQRLGEALMALPPVAGVWVRTSKPEAFMRGLVRCSLRLGSLSAP